MTDDLHDYRTTVRDVYRRIVGGSDADEGTNLGDARDTAMEQLLDMEARGEFKVPIADALRVAIDEVDRADGRLADRVLKAAAAGEQSLGVDGDPILDVIVTLGAGRRKPWRNVNRTDLIAMDALRFANLRNAQNGYADWHDTYERAFVAVDQHGTFGAAVAAGAFEPPGT